MGIDFWGVVYGTKAFLPYLKEVEEGHLVNIGSIFGLIGIPAKGAYSAAKFAVNPSYYQNLIVFGGKAMGLLVRN